MQLSEEILHDRVLIDHLHGLLSELFHQQFIAMSLLAPLETLEFSSCKELVDAIQMHVRSNGYAISTHRFSPKDATIYLRCDRD